MRKFARVEAILHTALAECPSWMRAVQHEIRALTADIELLRHAGCYPSTGIPAYHRSSGRRTGGHPDGGVSVRALNDEMLAEFRQIAGNDARRLRELEGQLNEYTCLIAHVETAFGLLGGDEMTNWMRRIYGHPRNPLPITSLDLPWCREKFDEKLSNALTVLASYLEPRIVEDAFFRIAGLYPNCFEKKVPYLSKTRKKSIDLCVTIAI